MQRPRSNAARISTTLAGLLAAAALRAESPPASPERVRQAADTRVNLDPLEADQPWERGARDGSGVSVTAVARDEEGRYRLWYEMIGRRDRVTGLAASEDGVHWSKPDLGLVGYAGSRHTNVCRLEPIGLPLRGRVSLIQAPPAVRLRFLARMADVHAFQIR